MPTGIYVRTEEARTNIGKANLRHGHSAGGKLSREYISWRAAWQRCFDPKAKSYARYGGRGITMCGHWKSDFSRFLSDLGPRPTGMSIERIDNGLGYLCPLCIPPIGNCKWATASEQQRNKEPYSEEARKKKSDWWMSQSSEYRHQRAVEAARKRWGG